jgi:hypothetical protein
LRRLTLTGTFLWDIPQFDIGCIAMAELEQLCMFKLQLPAPKASRTQSARLTELGEPRSAVSSSSSSNLAGSSNSAIAGSSPLAALTHLHIEDCWLDSLGWLPGLSGLQRLELQRMGPMDSAGLAAALPHLLQLTSLSLAYGYWAGYVVAAASSLSRLQSMNLHSIGTTPDGRQEPIVLSCLPLSLTSLELIACAVSSSASGDSSSSNSSSSSSSSSSQLTALQRLVLT